MASYFGINSDYNFWGTSSSSSTGSSSMLSDYALIRSGAYKKLMNAYYGKSSSSSGSVDSETEKAEKLEKINLKTINTAAGSLKSSAAALKTGKVFEKKVNEETGVAEYDKEAIKEKVSAFVESYNKTIDAAGDSDTTSVLRKTIWMINDVKVNAGLLEDVGITIGEDNKLSLSETSLAEADMSTLKTLFSGTNSLADKVMSKASELGRLSDAAMNTKTRSTVSYSSSGDYTTLNTSSIYDSFF